MRWLRCVCHSQSVAFWVTVVAQNVDHNSCVFVGFSRIIHEHGWLIVRGVRNSHGDSRCAQVSLPVCHSIFKAICANKACVRRVGHRSVAIDLNGTIGRFRRIRNSQRVALWVTVVAQNVHDNSRVLIGQRAVIHHNRRIIVIGGACREVQIRDHNSLFTNVAIGILNLDPRDGAGHGNKG